MGRFLNADAYASTGQGLLGNNMFAYCLNNPVNRIDTCGTASELTDDDPTNDINLYGQGGKGGTGYGAVISASLAAGIIAAKNKKPINLPSKKKMTIDIDHIASGHMPDGPRNPKGNKSVFWGLTTAQIVKAIYEAYSTASKLQTQGDRIKLIGYSQSYNLLIEMWIDTVELIIKTAYPR